MLLQDAPPDTSAYMIAGYVIFFTIGIVYLLSLAIRRRNLEQDLTTLEAIEAEARRASAGAASASSSLHNRKPRRSTASGRKPAGKKITRRK